MKVCYNIIVAHYQGVNGNDRLAYHPMGIAAELGVSRLVRVQMERYRQGPRELLAAHFKSE